MRKPDVNILVGFGIVLAINVYLIAFGSLWKEYLLNLGNGNSGWTWVAAYLRSGPFIGRMFATYISAFVLTFPVLLGGSVLPKRIQYGLCPGSGVATALFWTFFMTVEGEMLRNEITGENLTSTDGLVYIFLPVVAFWISLGVQGLGLLLNVLLLMRRMATSESVACR